MSGPEFRQIRRNLGFTLRDLAERWNVDKRTVHREERKRKVRGLYRDAIKTLKREHENGTESK